MVMSLFYFSTDYVAILVAGMTCQTALVQLLLDKMCKHNIFCDLENILVLVTSFT